MRNSIILQPGYTEKELFLAAITVQLEKYSLEGENGENSNNARLFESPQIIEHKSGALELSAAEHSAESADKFNEFMHKALPTSAWAEVKNQYPFQTIEQAKPIPIMPTMLKLANYLASFVDAFQKLAPEIESRLSEHPNLIIDSNLILSLAVALKNVLTPKNDVPEELSQIYTLFSRLENRVLAERFMAPSQKKSVEECCKSIMRQISLIITPPIGSEIAYGGMLGNSDEDNLIRGIFDTDYGSEKYKQFNFPEHYVIPSFCFAFLENEGDQKILWKFLAGNIGFLKQIEVKCHSLLYKATLQRLWDAFVQDEKCPQWIKNKKNELREKIYVQPTSILILFDGFSDRIELCNKTNPNSLQEMLKALVEETLLALTKNTHMSLNKENLAQKLSSLIDVYIEGKTFHARSCYTIIIIAHAILKSIEPKDITNPEKIAEACRKSDTLKEILSFIEERIISLNASSNTSKKEKDNLSRAILDLKGSFPEKYFSSIIGREESRRSISPTSVINFSGLWRRSNSPGATPPASPPSSP